VEVEYVSNGMYVITKSTNCYVHRCVSLLKLSNWYFPIWWLFDFSNKNK